MMSTIEAAPPPRWLQVFWGGLAIGLADTVFFSIFWSLRGVSPWRIFQTIASGVLGKASYAGGTPTVLLGVVLHFFIATMFVLVYTLASRQWPALLRRLGIHGPAYGLVVYLAMTYVVVPLSQVPQSKGPENYLWSALSIVFHMLVVGSVSVAFARRALRSS